MTGFISFLDRNQFLKIAITFVAGFSPLVLMAISTLNFLH